MQAHYRSTLDFSNEALQAAEKGLKRVLQAAKDIREIAAAAGIAEIPADIAATSEEINSLVEKVYDALCDDLNTPVALAHIFDAVRIINTAKDGKLKLTAEDTACLLKLFDDIVFGVLGLKDEDGDSGKSGKIIDGLVNMVLEQRKAAKANKDWATSDRIRDELNALGIHIKDTKDGTEWTL